MSVNRVILLGNTGADPEVKTTASGMTIANLRVATSERRKDKDSGEWAEETEWHRVVCFGKTAENVARWVQKGKQLYIEGKIKTRKWQDKDGNDRYSTEILADTVQFLGGGNGGRRQAEDGGGYANSEGGEGQKPDDDLPF